MRLYATLHLDQLRTAGERERQIRAALRDHLQKPIAKLQRADIQAAVDAKVAEGKLGAANRIRSALLAFCRWAWERGHLSEHIGLGTKRAAKEKPRERVLSLGEVRALWQATYATGDMWGPFLRLLILTAQRRGDVAGMRWSEIDLDARRWSIPGERTKNGKPHIVHMGNTVPSNFKPLELVPFNEACKPFLKDVWLVGDILPGQGLAVMFGAPSSGKTFTAIDLACHVASGLGDWRGKYVEHRAVLYLSLEGGEPFRNRLHAWCKHYEMDSACFCLCSEKLDLRVSETDCNRVIAAGRRIADESGRPVGLVVVDTLNRAMPGGNENAVEDMGAFVAHCDAIARALTCLVLIIHHSGKDAAKGSRGHSSLLGAIDCELSVADSAITVIKQRDGEAGAVFGFNLVPVEIGTSEKRGKLVFSCVAEPAEAPEKSRSSGRVIGVWWVPCGNIWLTMANPVPAGPAGLSGVRSSALRETRSWTSPKNVSQVARREISGRTRAGG